MEDPRPTILCVDDDPEVLDVLSEYLTTQGYDVITATNGVEAFLQVWRRRPRAVILDLFMPRLGGLGALDRIRRLDASIVIILISGVQNALEMITEAGVGVAGALAKPFDPAQLLAMLVQAGVARATIPARATGVEGRAAEPPSLRKRVLVVDDEAEFREMLVEYLHGKGFEAFGAGGGEEALELIPKFRPGVVLLDVVMPRMTGVEVLKRIKALREETCVVMVSGRGDEEIAKRTLGMGAADYISKPVDFAYLDSVLETHFLIVQFDPVPPSGGSASS